MSEYDIQLSNHLNQLKQKTIQISKIDSNKDSLIKEIKSDLESAPQSIKGKLFEKYIVFLYEGNGYLAKHNGKKGDNGADVLLYSPQEPNRIERIVQTKNYKKPLTVKEAKAELIQFEESGKAFYNCYQYHLIAINGFVKNCEKLKHYNMKMDSWTYVEKLILDFKEDVLSMKKRVPRLELNAHNQVAYEEIVEFLTHHDTLAVVRATGTGKSYLISELVHEYDHNKKIVLAPSQHILKNLKKKNHLSIEENITYLTYQKLSKMKKEELLSLQADLIIFDEFHRLGAKEWGKFSICLKELNKNAKIIGFSATPIRFLDNNRDMVEEFFEGQKIRELSLADAIVQRILPTPTYISSIYTLEEELRLCEKRIDQSFISNEETLRAKRTLKEISENWENAYGVDQILAKYLPQTDENMKFIVFCEDIAHLNAVYIEVQDWFNKALNRGHQKQFKKIQPYQIHSKVSGKKEELECFENNRKKNTIDLLFSVDMFNEGLHVEGITGVILLRTTSSPTIYYQQIGRALAVGNQNPIIFDLVNNFDSLKTGEGYHLASALEKAKEEERNRRERDGLPVNLPKVKIIDLLEDCKGLFRDIDCYLKDSWNFRYQELKVFYEKFQHSNVPAKYEENPQLGLWVSTQRQVYRKSKLSQEKIDSLNELNFDWDPNENQWNLKYQELKAYYEKHQHSNVPNKYEENPQLGLWVLTQRQAYKKDELPQEKIDSLNELNFDWDPFETQWKMMYHQLKVFCEKYQDFSILKEYKENSQLRRWVDSQRQAYKKNKLSQEKIDSLNELNFDWDPFETQWKMMYRQLKAYYENHQHSNVPTKCEENSQLGLWVSTQRQVYRKSKLSQEKIDSLNELNFDWDPNETQWNLMYRQLKTYYEKHQHCNVPAKCEENYRLGEWVIKQRQAYKKNKLSQEKIDSLNELNFDWDPFETQWKMIYRQLKTYYEKHQHCNVPKKYKEDPQLGKWVITQRQAYKKNKLSQAKIDSLNELNFDWDSNETQWNLMYRHLKAYYEKHQNCNVPAKYEENPQLGLWVSTQRQVYRKSKLSQEKIDSLNELNFDWDPNETQWNLMYRHLKNYYEKHQNCNVPAKCEENSRLGEWVIKQRQAYKKNKLSQRKIDSLNELNFDWNPLETQWGLMYQGLKVFYETHQHCNVPNKYEENPKLGEWVNNQRQAYKKNKLSQEKIDSLNELNFDWDPNETQWNLMYHQLKNYYEKHQNCNVPAKCEENLQLGRWVSTQRQVYRKNKLSQEKIDSLNELNFDWDSFETQWNLRYQELKVFHEKHQHCNVPFKYEENLQLGRWVSTQRQVYRKNKLSQEKIDSLNELNFDWRS